MAIEFRVVVSACIALLIVIPNVPKLYSLKAAEFVNITVKHLVFLFTRK